MNEHDIPQRPLPDQARAQRREELLAAIEADPGRRRWLLPAAVAAAVVAITAGVSVLVTGGEPATDPVGPAGAPSDTTSPTQSASEPTVTDQTTTAETARPGSRQESPPVPCAELPGLPGQEVGAIDIDETTVRVYSDGRRWVTCDEWAAIDGGEATLFAERPVGGAPSKELFLLSMNFTFDAAEYVAGGLLPEGVTGITYRFPDGHVEDATIDGDVWAMAYFPTSGPMVGDGRLPSEPVAVEVALSGVVQTYQLRADRMEWCAQQNHGC